MFHILLSALLCTTPIDLTKRLPITEDYSRAESIAKVFKKPMIVLFTGSDWDASSKDFINNVLYENAFYDVLKKEFVFAHVDFPEIETHDPALIEKNTALKAKYHVEAFPMLVLLDTEQNEISRIGLFSKDPEQLAGHLKSLLSRYQEIEKGLMLQTIDCARLKDYYTNAKELGAPVILARVLERGLGIETDPYFHLEHYSNQLTSGVATDEELATLRKKIVSIDPDNTFGAHYRLAILDFQSSAETTADVNDAIAPLLGYIEKYGKSDKDNLWRLHMMVSQYLFSKGDSSKALEHARVSYQEAPSFMKRNVFQNVEFLKKEVANRS